MLDYGVKGKVNIILLDVWVDAYATTEYINNYLTADLRASDTMIYIYIYTCYYKYYYRRYYDTTSKMENELCCHVLVQ